MFPSRSTLPPLVGAVLLAASAHAGVVWEAKSLATPPAPRVVHIQGDSMRMDLSGHSVIIRLDKGLMWEVHDFTKTYRELSFAQLGDTLTKARKKMETLPPEKRAAMAKELQPFDTGTAQLVNLGTEKNVAGHACIGQRIVLGPITETVCAAKDLDLGAEAKAFYAKLGVTIEQTTGLDSLRAQADVYQKLAGLAVEQTSVVHLRDGTKREETFVFVSYAEKKLPASLFEIPAGYERSDTPRAVGTPAAPTIGFGKSKT